MENDWRANLARYFEEYRILKNSIKETLDNFEQFCEFVVEPAFESLENELEQYGISSKVIRVKGKSINFQINFAKTRIDNFLYSIFLPKNSLELELYLKIRGRANKKSHHQEKIEPFMQEMKAPDILKLGKEDLILNIIEHYRSFNFEAFTNKKES
jgi:hypothetical protein